MIFASVGSMFPFDRLVIAVDEWAAANPDQPVFIQIGEGKYEPRHAPFARMIPMADYRQRMIDCDLFVAHVGTGSLLQALELGKQMLLMPRHQSLGEHTTEHQLDTARRFRHVKGVRIADDVDELKAEMTRMLAEPIPTGDVTSSQASDELLGNVRRFLESVDRR